MQAKTRLLKIGRNQSTAGILTEIEYSTGISMKIDIGNRDLPGNKSDCLVIPLLKHNRLTQSAEIVNDATGGRLKTLLKESRFKSEPGNTLLLHALDGVSAKSVMLYSVGNASEITRENLGQSIEAVSQRLASENCRNALIVLPFEDATSSDNYGIAREAAMVVAASDYLFDSCKSEKPDPVSLQRVDFHAGKKPLSSARRGVNHGQAIAGAMQLAKDLGNLPGNICTPAYLASEAKKLAGKYRKLTASALDEKEMKKLGMGALLSVTRGSRQPARLITMHYKGGKPKEKPVVLVGKGLTFDAGGISIKPSARMDEMKYDMCGSASVFGAVKACAELELPINLVGIIPSSENLPDGDANKPGDIVTSMAGLTIEVLNTDAEGRLILCDALTYAGRYDPAVVIDIATLTGACITALGHHTSGLMANDDRLADALLEAGREINDRAWRLPLWEEYHKQLQSNFADLANIGGPPAGTITATGHISTSQGRPGWGATPKAPPEDRSRCSSITC
jgi:leucyl aminopeptidase